MNMSYCRFQSTLRDLRDCEEHLDDELSPEEERAKEKLIVVCKRIANGENNENK